ncbi:alpha-L-glutamate ligase-like protein [Hydrocarboniclastica marina]|uniref:Alpha-L-glutamate ligase-like protein n=1 Tax=Hydrocarboniclastica marina TaxID=2259620 RepID=A0A4V1D8T1_9ALTE|nr:alpha-L-glutamate ligase-like protein [Hydrocarboniclastica marina]QCF26270.1 alpha-L-glutamate ligase-like protein [Hydrocarboniclastica marina]
MWVKPSFLRHHGLLGMNRRNVQYINAYNSRDLYPLVDDKLKTKLLAVEYDIATPTLRQVVRAQHEISHFRDRVKDLPGFAIKPSKGSGGKGITVIERQDGDSFFKPSGSAVSIDHLSRHLSNILSGLYSLGGKTDVAIIEDLIVNDPDFAKLSHQGVPDIRIIVFRGYPVMAMLRLATQASDGKANLHQGAIGVGLDLSTGQGLHAVQYSKRVRNHPDTGLALLEIQIPDWFEMLRLAARCYDMTGLGYIGADLVVDKHRGPLLLELNARPGLAIQVANGVGLRPRLEHIEKLPRVKERAVDRVKYAMDVFSDPHYLPRPLAPVAGPTSTKRVG